MLHATDETVTEFAIEPYAADAPLHVVAMRTPQAKYATYSNWAEDRHRRRWRRARKSSCTTTARRAGAWSCTTAPAHSPLEQGLRAEYKSAVRDELRGPLPPRLVEAHARGFADYFSTRQARRRERGGTPQAARRTRSRRRAGGAPGAAQGERRCSGPGLGRRPFGGRLRGP